MKIQKLLHCLPEDFRIVLADVGSAGGFHPRWRDIQSIVSGLQFEPREFADTRHEGQNTVFPIGLGEFRARETLNITALENMSSTLEPNSDLLESYAKKFAHTRIVDRVDMEVDSLDSIVRERKLRVDALKVDTQGSELGILRGAKQCLEATAVMAEVEVSFFRRYRGQALCWDIVSWMDEHGFELVDLYRLKRYRRRNAAGIGNLSLGRGQRAGHLAYGDAIFFLQEDLLLDRIGNAGDAGGDIALRAIVCMLVYGKADMAAHLFDITSFAIDPTVKERVAKWLASLVRGPMKAGALHHLFDYAARKV